MGSLIDNADGTANKILAEIQASTEAFARNEPRAREKLLLLSDQLTAALETPGETVERVGWAQVKSRPRYPYLIVSLMIVLHSRLCMQLYDLESSWVFLRYSTKPAMLQSAFRNLQIRQVLKAQ